MNRRRRQRNIVDERRAVETSLPQERLDFVRSSLGHRRFKSPEKTRIGVEKAAPVRDKEMPALRRFEQMNLGRARR